MQTPNFPARTDGHDEGIRRAKALIPGGSTNSLVPPDGLEFLIDRGEGPFVFDADGRRYLDFMLGAGPLIFGHAHPRIVATIVAQATRGTQFFGLSSRALSLAERLVQHVPSAEMVRFTSSGTEATMHALRLARAVTGRRGVIKFDGAWHGHHDLAVWSMEGSPTTVPEPYAVSAGIQTGVKEDMMILHYNDAAAVREALRSHPERFAAVICEPAQRVLTPKPGFLETLREECDRAGTALIFDEVVTGFRVAAGGAQEKYGVTPDLTTLGKALSGGVPLSALVGKKRYMEHLTPGSDPTTFNFHCGTFNGNPIAAECAHTTIDMLVEEGGLAQLDALGTDMREALKKVFADLDLEAQIVGIGPMFHFFLTDAPVEDFAAVRRTNLKLSDSIHRRLYGLGVYKQFSKGYLSTVHTSAHIAEFCDLLRWCTLQALNA